MEAAADTQEHPIGIYFKVWGLLFVLSTFSYMVDYFDFQGYLRWGLILLFMFLKAGFIIAIFMHMAWERLALIYAILTPPIAILVLIFLMAIEADYVNWANNTDDSCSSLDAGSDLNLTQFPPGLSSAAIAADPFLLGDPRLSFLKPGMNNTGYIDIEVDLAIATGADLEWLYFDWDGDLVHDDNPTGRATFGVYRGGDNMIYLRELY